MVAFICLYPPVGWCCRYRPERPQGGDRWADRRVPEAVPGAGFPCVYWYCYSGIPVHHHLPRPQVSRYDFAFYPFAYPNLNRYGDKSMLWYITICSMIGGLSVSCTSGLGAAIVTSAMGDNQVGLCIVPVHQNSTSPSSSSTGSHTSSSYSSLLHSSRKFSISTRLLHYSIPWVHLCLSQWVC